MHIVGHLNFLRTKLIAYLTNDVLTTMHDISYRIRWQCIPLKNLLKDFLQKSKRCRDGG